MEIWGGNRAIDKSFVAPGLDIYVHSAPYQASLSGGGDIYYLTSCASGRISRFLLADVSGHGKEAAQLAISLRDLLRENVNKISQQQFVEGMNRQFGKVSRERGFATAVVATFFEPRKSLSVSVAGHPYPLYYQARSRTWYYLDPAESSAAMDNLPLGIHEESGYPGRTLTTESGDMFLLYSDAFIESVNSQDQQLGIKGVVDLLNEIGPQDPSRVIPCLCENIGGLADDNLQDDDATLILGHFTQTRVRMRDNLAAPFRLLGHVSDRTRLDGKSGSKA
jgi:serine phosphatase RsbU (regulator of sigma subunit)